MEASTRVKTIGALLATFLVVIIWARRSSDVAGTANFRSGRNGLTVNTDETDESSIRLAVFLELCSKGDQASVERMILSDASLLNQMDESGWTCVINAAKNNHVGLVKFLLGKGASTGTKSMKHSAMRGAALFGYDKVVLELLQANAIVDVYSMHQRTPLMGAAMNGHRQVVQLLLDAGAAKELKNDDGMTARDLAVKNGHLDIAEMLQ